VGKPCYPSVQTMMGIAAKSEAADGYNISELSFDKFNKLYYEKYNTILDPN
jgi:hypothetical protein